MGYLTNEEFKKKYGHYCWICKAYIGTPYTFKVAIGNIVVEIPLCFEHYNLIKNNSIKKVEE